MKPLVRLFLALVCAVAAAVLYIVLCYRGQPCCSAPGLRDSPTASSLRSFPGYSRVPDGKPLERALCRRCAIVSSSGQMLGSQLGQAIDGQECVLRMNHAPTSGYEQDVGARSTIRVVSHTSVPLLLGNQPYFFQQSQETLYFIWGPAKKMNREKMGSTYQALVKVMEKYPQLQIYTLTEEKMTYCDDIFQNETGKNRMKSGSFLSTGWFTMILAMELCEQICVFGMVSDSYCREKNHSSVPYHYFEKGRLDECKMYLMHEQARRAGHRFITEKAIFSRWAKRRNIVFNHPSWAGRGITGLSSSSQPSQHRSGQASGMQVLPAVELFPCATKPPRAGPELPGRRGKSSARRGCAAPGPARTGDRDISPGLSRWFSRPGEGGARIDPAALSLRGGRR